MSLSVNITKQYKGFSLHMEFETGEGLLGILGASGCGKSLTLKCIAGIVTPDEGRIVLNGNVLFDGDKKINIKPKDRKVGYLFQDYALFPNMTVFENILCAIRGKGRKAEEGAGEYICKFQLEGLEELYPHQLSGGQKQRTALARMMANEPEVLLLDEPFSALDYYLKEQLQLQMMDFLKSCRKDMIMVTHNRDEAYRLCRDLMIMDGGRKICTGSTKHIFRKPEYLAAARLTGCKNFSRVRKLDEHHAEALDWGVKLTCSGGIPDNVSHVGIRAHYFHPADKEGENSFPVELVEVVESPFEINLVMRSKRRIEGGTDIWWKLEKDTWFKTMKEVPPTHLYIAAEDVLALI